MNGAVMPVLECRNVYKTFPGVKALQNIQFSLMPGEVHGLIGENGAGKSTLIKIFCGIHQPDADKDGDSGIYLNGEKVEFKSPGHAIKHKIMTIHQELNIIPDLKVYDNIFLNNENKKNGFLDRKNMREQADEMIRKFDADFSANDVVKDLSADKQKLVEILRAIHQDAKVLIMDEPTSALTDVEAKHLFEIIKTITEKGISIIFISHNLNEIIDICDRITVLRDGVLIDTIHKEDATVDDLVDMMVGKELKNAGYSMEFTSVKQDDELLKVDKLCYRKELQDISFTLNKGEILGITGLVGSGGSVLAKSIFGMEGYKKDSGDVFINGEKTNIRSTSDAIKNKIAFLTEDRKGEGLFLKFGIYENTTIPALKNFVSKAGMLDTKKRKEVTDKYIDLLHIKTPNNETVTESLSGGNQQKVVIAKWLETQPNIMIMAEPTVGIDVAAKAEIRKTIRTLAEQGNGIILITNEYVELNELCDRVLVLFKGKIVKEIERDELTEDRVMKYSLGGEN